MKKGTFIKYGFVISVLSVLFLLACKKKDKSPEEANEETFDKQGMLINYADNLIIPAYSAFKISFDSLDLSFTTFKNNITLAAFQDLKTKLNAAYSRYQRVSLFGLGPAEDQGIRANFNVFPTNIGTINSNISADNYNLALVSNLSAKGFPALDYLLYGTGSEDDQFQLMKSDNKRIRYVGALINDMKVKLEAVLNNWNSSYRNTFVNSLGTDVGSSIGMFVNQINYELDYLKNAKIAIPLGLKSGGTLLPAHCEAYYGKQSLAYIFGTLNILEDTYLGRSAKGEDGKGFDDYIDHLGIQHIDQSLNAAIKLQFAAARAKLNLIGNPLSDQVTTNYNTVKDAYNELVKLLVLLKTDMPSGLGVVITYQDGDGD